MAEQNTIAEDAAKETTPKGIKSFLKQDMERAGVQYSDEKVDKILSTYNNDYDKIVRDAGKRAKVKDIELFRNKIYDHFKLGEEESPLVEQSQSFKKIAVDESATPIQTTQEQPSQLPKEGYEKYSKLKKELGIYNRDIQDLEEPKDPINLSQPFVAQQSSIKTQMPSELLIGDDSLHPLEKQARIEREQKETRYSALNTSIDATKQSIAEIAKQNIKDYGFASQEHEAIMANRDINKKLLDEAIQNKQNNATYLPTQSITGVSSTPVYKQEDKQKVRALRNVSEMYDKMDKILSSPQGESTREEFNGLIHGFSKNFFTKDFATLGLSEMDRLINVKNAFDAKEEIKTKLKSEGVSEEELDNKANDLMPNEQKALLDTYKLLLNIQSGSDANFMSGIGEGLKDMIPFVVQFAATGGTAAAGKKLVTDFVSKYTRNATAGKIAGAVTKPIVQSVLMAPALGQNFGQKVAPKMDQYGNLKEGTQSLEALGLAILDGAAEVIGEDATDFARKMASGAATKHYAKMIAGNPNMAQKILGKISLALTADTGIPTVQGFGFEGLGEEITGLLQAGINNDGSFFTSEAQSQLWVLSLLASGTTASLSIPSRINLKIKYNQGNKQLSDIGNQDVINAAKFAAENYNDPKGLVNALNHISREYKLSKEDFVKVQTYLGNTLQYNQMNTSRYIEIEQKIEQNKGNDGNVTLTYIDGKPYSIKNPEDLGKEGKMILVKSQDGTVIPKISSQITDWSTQNPADIVQSQMAEQDQGDEILQQEQELQQAAADKGLVEGKTVDTPHGKKTLVSINPDGTATVQDNKGEQIQVNTDEIQAYKTQEQKDAEKVEQEANLAMMEGIEEGAEVLNDQPLPDDPDIRIIDFSNGQSKIITPEGEQILNSPEERDTAIAELTGQNIEENDIDVLPPEQAFAAMLKEDPDNPEIATEIFAGEIADIRTKADEARQQVKETSSRKEKQKLLLQAKQLESEAERMEQVLADPRLLEQEKAEIPAEAKTVEAMADELSKEYQQEKENTPYSQLLPWQQELLGLKIRPDSFARWSDKNNVTLTLARSWFEPKSKANSANDIDAIAADISETSGTEVTPEDIIDFILSNPTNTVRSTTDRMNEIVSEYRQLTGKSIKNHTPKIQESAPELSDIEDNPLGTTREDIPFRVQESPRGVNVSKKAQSDIKTRKNAVTVIENMAVELDSPINVVNSKEVPRKLDKNNVIRNERGNMLGYVENGQIYLVSDNISSVSGAKATLINAALKTGGISSLATTNNKLNDKVTSLIDKFKNRTKQADVSVKSFMDSASKSEINDLLQIIRKGFGLTSNQYTETELRLADKQFDVQAIFDSLKTANSADVVVVQTAEELPKSVQNNKMFTWDRFDAVFYNGKVYVNSDIIRSKDDAIKIWVHENGLHNGIRTLIPDATDRNNLFEQVYDSVSSMVESSPELREAVFRVTKGAYKNQSKAEQGEEILAFYAEKVIKEEHLTPAEQDIWTKISDYIRDILSKLYNFDATLLTEEDLANIVYSSVKANFNERGDSNTGTDQEVRKKTQDGASNTSADQGQDVSGQELQRGNENPLFRAQPIEGSDNLIVLHNLSASNILHIDKIGGLPVPSLAISRTDTPFESFGDISLIANKDLIDPKKAREAKTFNADIYSPRYPGVTYDVNRKKYNNTFAEINKEAEDIYGLRPVSIDQIESDGAKSFRFDATAKLMFLKEKGIAPKAKTEKTDLPKILHKYIGNKQSSYQLTNNKQFVDDVTSFYKEQEDLLVREDGTLRRSFIDEEGNLNRNLLSRKASDVASTKGAVSPNKTANEGIINEKIRKSPKLEAEYEQWSADLANDIVDNERIFDGFTYSGNRKYLPHNIQTVVKLLKRGLQGGEGFNYDVGTVRSGAAKQFKSIKDIQADRNKIISKEEMEPIKEAVSSEFMEILEELRPFYKYDKNSFGYLNDASEAMYEMARGKGLQDFEDVPTETLTKARDFITKLRNMPTEYFESKIQRSVGLYEFQAAVVPNGTSQKVLDILYNNAIKVIKYNPKKEGDRAKKTEQISKKEDLRFRTESPRFYSPTEKALELIQQDKGTAGQFKSMLLKNGAKQAELDWMGWDTAFDGVNKKVTKQEIQEWIDSNKVEIEEVQKTASNRYSQSDIKDAIIDYSGSGYWVVSFKNELDDISFPLYQADDKNEAYTYALDEANYSFTEDLNSKPKFSDYQEPGGENYKEVLLTMPVEKDSFKSSHFSEPNILAHVRFNERTDTDGNKVLFLEEIQSDWAQEGKKKGFKGKAEQTELDFINYRDDLFEKYDISSVDELQGRATANEIQTVRELFRKENDRDIIDIGSTPDMPLKKTDQWVNLSLNHAIRYAAENGFDKVAWTTGEQQAARYDLSKQIDKVEVENKADGIRYVKIHLVGQSYNSFDVDKNGVIVKHAQWEGKQLDEVIGKEMADKILSTDSDKTFSELDLKVGGEGMKAFYNQIIPKAANKLGKKFGATVQPTEINFGDDINQETGEILPDNKQTVLSIPITDKMKESVTSEGVPMFRVSENDDLLTKIEKGYNFVNKNGVYEAKEPPKQLSLFPEGKDFVNQTKGNYIQWEENKAKVDDNSITFSERLSSETPNATLLGEPLTGYPTIKDASDVANIFKNLESASSENAFAVLQKNDGTFKVLYIATGATNATIVEPKHVVAAAKEYGADSLTFVHNHPSGNLFKSDADTAMHIKLKQALSPLNIILNDSVIINLDSGKYATFNDDSHSIRDKKSIDSSKEVPLPLMSFDRQKLYVPSAEKTIIKGSDDVAKFLSKIKRGTTPSTGIIILDQRNAITRYSLLDESISKDELIATITYELSKYGQSVILNSNSTINQLLKDEITEAIKPLGQLLDVVENQISPELIDSYNSLLYEPTEDVKFRVESPTVYHGSDQAIDKFDINKASGSGKASRNKAGVFFTTDQNFAKSWGENMNERKLQLNKPLTVDSNDPIIKEIFGEKGFSGNIKSITEKKANKLKEAGFDGVIGWERWTDWKANNRKTSDVYMMFDVNGIIKPRDDVRFRLDVNPRQRLTKVRGGWTKDKIVKELKNIKKSNPGSYGTFNQLKGIAQYDNADDLRKHLFYHGTGSGVYGALYPSITMSEREAEENGGGGYGERYFAVSVSKSKKKAAAFSGMSRSLSIYHVLLNKDAKVIDRPDLQDSNELEDEIEQLWNDGVDAVRLGDWSEDSSEQELAVLNPIAISTWASSENYAVFGMNLSKIIEPTDAELENVIANSKQAIIEFGNWKEDNPEPTMEDFQDYWARLKELPFSEQLIEKQKRKSIRDEYNAILRREKSKYTNDIRFKIENERDNVTPSPTEAQKEAGNYSMGHVRFDGFDITIENPKGSIRSGVNSDGEKWSNILPADYGYFKGTVGKDKDHIDTFMGDNLESDKVYVVDQINPETGKFDEHKVMLGYNSISEARSAYNEAYDEGWKGLGAITRTNKDGLKEWFKGDTKKPFGLKEDIRFRATSNNPEVQKALDKLQEIEALSKTAAKIKGLEDQSKKAMGVERDYITNQIAQIKEVSKDEKADTKAMIATVQKAIADYAKKTLPLTEAGAREISPILTLISKAQTPEAIEQAFNKIDELTGITEDNINRKKATSKVNRLLAWMTGLKKSGNTKVGKFDYQDTKAFQELKKVNDEVMQLVKQTNSWKATAEEKMDAEAKLDAKFEALNSKEDKSDLDNAMMKLIELRRLGAKATPELAQAVSDELEAIYIAAKEAKSESYMEKALRRKENRDLVINNLEDDTSHKKLDWYKRAMRSINNRTADIMGNWETIMTMIGGTELRDKTSFLLDEAQISVGKQESINNVLSKAKTIYGIDTKMGTLNKIHDLSKKEYSLRQPNRLGDAGKGDPIELSKLDLMDIYNATKEERIAEDYYMTYGDLILAADGSRDTNAQMASGKATIDDLIAKLSDADKSFADALQDEVGKYYDKINPIHIQLYNRDLPRVDNYWPSTAERVKDIDPMEQVSADYRYPSAIKERTSHRSPKPSDAFNKFMKHIEEAEWFINMALPYKTANDIFKDNNVRALIESKRGEDFLSLIDQSLVNTTLNAPNKLQQKGFIDKVFNPLLNNWVVSKIGMTPSVPLKQLLSAVNYAENMPIENWAVGFVKGLSSPKDSWAEMMKIPYLKTRLGNGYSEAVQRALNGDDQVHRSKATNYHEAFKNLMTIGTRYGDMTAIIFGGKPYLDYLIKTDGLSEKEAVDKFLQDTLRSQQSPFSSSLSKFQNAKNPFARAVFAFSNTPSQYMRKLFEANQDYRVKKTQFDNGKITKDELAKSKKQAIKIHAIYGVINTISYTAAGALISAAMRGSDWEDELWKDMLLQLEQTYIGGLPVIKYIIEVGTRATLDMPIYQESKPMLEGIDQAMSAGIKILKGDAENPDKEYDKMGQGIATMLGIPYYNLQKTIKAFPPFRESTFRETRIEEVEDKINDFADSDDAMVSEAANKLKRVYTNAKSKATRLKNNNKPFQSERITTIIEDSKINMWDEEYSALDMNLQADMINRMIDSIE